MPECPRAHAEFTAERSVEVRYVAETAVERDVEHLFRPGCQPRGRFAQAAAQHVLMGRDACETPEGAEEMVRAEIRLSRQLSKSQRRARVAIDRSGCPRHASFGVQWQRVPVHASIT